MPEDLSEQDMPLESKVNACKSKSAALQKGLTKEKNGRAARKREYMAQTLQPPEELIQLLQADGTDNGGRRGECTRHSSQKVCEGKVGSYCIPVDMAHSLSICFLGLPV